MYEYNPQTGQWEDPEERRKREEEQAKALGTTEVGKKEIVTYADGSQTHKTTQEVPNPGFFDRLGSAFQQAGNNFVNNIQNAPQNLINNVGNLGQQQPRPQPQPTPTPQQQFMAAPIAPDMPPVDYSMATQQGGPGLRYGNAFAPQQAQQPVAQPAVPNQPQTQPAPIVDRAARVAQRESNGNFDIGYHFPADEQGRRKSSAYGGFGITAPAYQDIQKADPYFANRPITSLNRDDQTRAFNTLSNLNAQRLQRAGVEPTPQNLDLAHFFGAGGAANYLKNGYISPQAAGANGGADKVRAVADKILSGGQVAVSGAAEPGAVAQPAQPAQPAITPVQAGITAYQTNQDDPMALLQLRNNANAPEFIRQRAANRAYELMDAEVKKQQAQSQMGNLTPQEMSRVLTKRSEGNTVGDWLQYLLFKHVGLTDLANEKGDQLGIGRAWTRSNIQDAQGNMLPVEIQTSASGKLLQGNLLDGTPLTKEQLNQLGMGLGKGASVSAEVYVDTKTNARYRSGVDSQGNAQLINIQGGRPFRGDPKDLVVQSIGTAAQKAENAAAIGLRYAAPLSFNKASAGEAGKFSQQNGVRVDYATQTPGAPLMDLNTGKQLVPDANGNITITKNDGGTITVATGAAPAQAQAAPTAQTTPQYGPPAPKYRERGFENESPATFSARQKAWQETYTKQYEDTQKNLKTARELLPDVVKMKKLIDQGTGSGIGTIVDNAGNFFGYSTPGATAIAAIAPLANQVLMGVQRFEGPQSDADVKSYKEAAGRLADPTVPPAQKQAAFATIIEIMRRRAPDLEWDKVLAQGTSTEGTTASGNKYKKVQ